MDDMHGSRWGDIRWTICLAALVLVLPALPGCARQQQVEDAAGATAGSAAAAVDAGIDNLNAVLWMQSAVEYRATSLQAYALGRRVLDEALADPGWTAALEQTGDYAGLPPAVILDVDETVLDNSYFEARLTLDRQRYSSAVWDEWVLEEAATPIPGAREFLEYAVSRGVTIFYVSNRRAHLEQATSANLAAAGMPISEGLDTLLLRGEVAAWETSDKTPRRQAVAASHRVLMMFGDNMGDFTAASDGTVAERDAFAAAHRDWWGTRWITLANPTYGSFIDAVLGEATGAPWEQQVQRKKQALDPKR
jgi:acid phosphatase